jgi:hypothetical protein
MFIEENGVAVFEINKCIELEGVHNYPVSADKFW